MTGSTSIFLASLNIIKTIDLVMYPVFLAIFIGVFVLIRNNRYNNSIVAKYFIPALLFRYLGAFLTAAMYQYYYGYGDTFYYFIGVNDIFEKFIQDPLTGLEMIFMPYDLYSNEANEALTLHLLFKQTPSAVVMKTGGFFGIFTFGSYLGVSLGMTTISFIGCWALYRVFYDLYPKLHWPLALSILFVPSLCFWGTGLMKDPMALGGVGMFVYGLYFIFYKRKRGLLLPLAMLLYGGYLAITIKTYIALAIFPAALVWITLLYKNKIQNRTLRQLAGPILLVFGLFFGLFALQQLGNISEKFAIENMVVEAAKTQWWLSVSTERDGGTGYSLGEIEPTITGLLKKVPVSVNVALFRPYIWEARKPIVLPSAAEALICLFLTLYVFFKVGLLRTIGAFFRDPTVLFCLIFAIIFAFAVGFTSMNFGALARYKIPCLPFYFSAMVILLYGDENSQEIVSNKMNSRKLVDGLPLQ